MVSFCGFGPSRVQAASAAATSTALRIGARQRDDRAQCENEGSRGAGDEVDGRAVVTVEARAERRDGDRCGGEAGAQGPRSLRARVRDEHARAGERRSTERDEPAVPVHAAQPELVVASLLLPGEQRAEAAGADEEETEKATHHWGCS